LRGRSKPNCRIRPTAALESILITGVTKAKEDRDVMTCDIPDVFIKAYLPKKEPGDNRVVMKITGVLVNMLVNINPETVWPSHSVGEPQEGSIC
jgi:hypothetical protein